VVVHAPSGPPIAASPEAAPADAAPGFPADVQVVEFTVPAGVGVELLGPASEALPPYEGTAGTRFGLKVGVGYHFRLVNLPNRPDVELYPVLEVVGHLHRPPDVNPMRFPVRVVFNNDDLDDVILHGRLVTHVVYLEDPDQALPMNLPKNEIPVTTISPAEEPLKVASALGRPMAIVRLGGRVPNPEDWSVVASSLAGAAPCPYVGPSGARCAVPCGPIRTLAPQRGGVWLPRDEYLCDGGDHGEPAHFSEKGDVQGVDPRDALLRFQAVNRPRVLPTNTVCMYAPRFAAVRAGVGANEALSVTELAGAGTFQREEIGERIITARRFTQNQAAEANRHHARVSSMSSRILPFGHTEIRILQGYDTITHVAGHVTVQRADIARRSQIAYNARQAMLPVLLRSAETAVVTGIVQSANTTVMSWPARDVVGVEEPIKRPGLAVIKRVSTDVAEPGDVVTYTIQFRNMGSTEISSVSVLDSLLPRLEYVRGSAQGPKGTVFTAADNRAGSTELRWDLPAPLAPGAEGYVSFQAKVR
jgi:uncharacterized repeat protein (TIGR01451 family)